MLYTNQTELDKKRFLEKAQYYADRGETVEMTRKTFRSSNQNRYLHCILGLLAIEVGETLDYVKTFYYKRLFNPDIFIIEREDKLCGKIEILRSSASLTKDEMSLSIERLRDRASRDLGCYLPSADEESLLRQAEIEINKYRRYL